VAILSEQRPEFVFHHFALNALGCSTVTVSPDYRHDEIVYLLDHSECCLAPGVKERLADLQAATRALPKPIPVVLFDDLSVPLPTPATPTQNITLDGKTEAGLLYTSGTTGRPKGCVLTNEYFSLLGAVVSLAWKHTGVEDLPGAIQRALANLPALLDVVVTPEAKSSDSKTALAWVPDLQALGAWDEAERKRRQGDVHR
jgi:acyl-CoA synthetase (AMP-forming)/AMP-acid ligase II